MAEAKTIFVVEDNDDDYEATERALKKARSLTVRRARDAEVAWAELIRAAEDSNDEPDALPGVVLLDLNMPGLDGRWLLNKMKSHGILRAIPTVVMTTSVDPIDVNACYAAGANTYIPKPMSLDDFSEAMERLHAYWFRVAMLPSLGES